MDIRKEKKNIIWVIISNLICLLFSVIASFLIPKVLTVDSYAEYKTYTLYVTYIGIFHFGFINGIYLKYGGYDYDNLPMNLFSIYSKTLLISQFIIQVIGFIILFFISKGNIFETPFFYVILNIFAINISCYFSLINQCGKKFVHDSIMQIISKVFLLFVVVAMYFVSIDNGRILLIAVTIINYVVSLLWCILNRQLIVNSNNRIIELKHDILLKIRTGFWVMISEYVALIILGIDSIFVNVLFPKYDFSMYSLAITITTLFLSVINIVSKLIYPYLMRADSDSYSQIYIKLNGYISAVVCMGISILFLLNYFIMIYIPEYKDSIQILGVLGTIVIFKTLLELVCGNFYKVLRKEQAFFKNNMFALVIALVFNVLFYIIFRNVIAIAYASVLTFFIWYFVANSYFLSILKIKKNIQTYIPLLMAIIYIICNITNIKYIGLLYSFISIIYAFLILKSSKYGG